MNGTFLSYTNERFNKKSLLLFQQLFVEPEK